MVKVTKGTLSGERPKRYPSYTSNYGVGPSVAVRRGVPTTALPTIGTSLAQKQQKASFAAATKTYSKYNALHKDFFKRWWLIDKTIDNQGRTAKRYITGRQLAIKDIARTVSTSGQKYLKPLGFCICAVDLEGNPALGHELNITCPKLRNFTYKEENDNFACFPPSALGPKYEPYHLFYTDAADYCLLTAEQIHKIKTLHVVKQQELWQRQKTWGNCSSSYEPLYTLNFQEQNIFEEEVKIAFIWNSSFQSESYIEMWLYCLGRGNPIITQINPGEDITTIVYITVKDGCTITRHWTTKPSTPLDLTLTETIVLIDERPC